MENKIRDLLSELYSSESSSFTKPITNTQSIMTIPERLRFVKIVGYLSHILSSFISA